jgi:hypothetical protein
MHTHALTSDLAMAALTGAAAHALILRARTGTCPASNSSNEHAESLSAIQ